MSEKEIKELYDELFDYLKKSTKKEGATPDEMKAIAEVARVLLKVITLRWKW